MLGDGAEVTFPAVRSWIAVAGFGAVQLLETVLKAGALAISFIGTVINADAIWDAGDIGYGLIGWMNMVSILLLTPVVRKVIRDYDHQRRLGLDPVFDPHRLGIQGAEYWENEVAENRART